MKRLTRSEVIERLLNGEKLIDNGINAKFADGSLCNIFTFWWLRDKNLINPETKNGITTWSPIGWLNPPKPEVSK